MDDSPTVLKVVESALTRAGFRVDTARDAASGLELARRSRPALILVDSLMPEEPNRPVTPPASPEEPTGGHALCGALAADQTLAHTPVVLMTTKGEDVEVRYARTPNIIDYITKPFSPDAVLAVVTHVIEKTGLGTVPDVPFGSDRQQRPSAAIAEALFRSGDRAGGRARTSIETGRGDGDQQDDQLGGDDEFDAIDAFEAPELAGEPPDLAGQMRSIGLGEILSLLAQELQTGTLRATSGGARVDVYFRNGKIDFAAAVGVAEEFLLGRFVVETGQLRPEDVLAVLEHRNRQKREGTLEVSLFGRDLIARGLLTAEQLEVAMRRQTAELVHEVLRWADGTFSYRRTEDLPELARDAALGMSVDTLLLEGLRRVDEWRIIEREIASFDLVFVRDDERITGLPRGALTREEITVLDALNGRSSVRDVVRQLRLGSFDVSKILFRLLRTKLIRRRMQPIATAG